MLPILSNSRSISMTRINVKKMPQNRRCISVEIVRFTLHPKIVCWLMMNTKQRRIVLNWRQAIRKNILLNLIMYGYANSVWTTTVSPLDIHPQKHKTHAYYWSNQQRIKTRSVIKRRYLYSVLISVVVWIALLRVKPGWIQSRKPSSMRSIEWKLKNKNLKLGSLLLEVKLDF